ncbi:MAG: IMP dehydrogenase [bacterium]|nr:IMP dehydrogenase [bacterium]
MREEIVEVARQGWPQNLYQFKGIAYRGIEVPPMGKNIAKSRNSISLKTRFSRKITMNQPIVTANMLDITESKMLEKAALLGGLGIMHRFCEIDKQIKEIEKAKRAHNFVIKRPYQIDAWKTVGEARAIMTRHNVGSLLVRDKSCCLSGILTVRDIKMEQDSEHVCNRMTPTEKLIVFKHGEDQSIESITRKFKETKIKHYPIVDDDNKIKGLICVKDVFKLREYPFANIDQNGQLVVGAAIGAVGDYLERAQELIKAGANVIVIDITSGYSTQMEKAIKEFRKKFGEFQLVAGNIGTSEQARGIIEFSEGGIDGLKIGLGPGGVCTTRMNTGIGVIQFYAVLEIYWGLIFKYGYKPENIPPLCADGNIRCGADVSHALMAGSDSIMGGTIFSATKETPGMPYPKEDGEYKKMRGMASTEALAERYEAEGFDDPMGEALKKSPEGMEREVKIKGSVENIINKLNGGLRSFISHRGALSLEEAKHNFNPFCQEYGFTILKESGIKESYER